MPLRHVRKAEIKDISGILSILNQNLIANKTIQKPETLEQTGFLIQGFSVDDAKSAIADKDNFIFLVATENDEIIGYVIGCDVKKLDPDFQLALSSLSTQLGHLIASEKIFYLRHIAKKIETTGVGKALLQQLLDCSKQANYGYVICQIAEKPIQNKISKRFHEKNGFVCVGYNTNAGKTYGVYLKKIE